VIPKVKENRVGDYATFDLGACVIGEIEPHDIGDATHVATCRIDGDEWRGSFDACQTWLYARLKSFGFDVELERK
jgi:hypothetical protein